jgi:hypothetical protein
MLPQGSAWSSWSMAFPCHPSRPDAGVDICKSIVHIILTMSHSPYTVYFAHIPP